MEVRGLNNALPFIGSVDQDKADYIIPGTTGTYIIQFSERQNGYFLAAVSTRLVGVLLGFSGG